jgi:hypothetical protein
MERKKARRSSLSAHRAHKSLAKLAAAAAAVPAPGNVKAMARKASKTQENRRQTIVTRPKARSATQDTRQDEVNARLA